MNLPRGLFGSITLEDVKMAQDNKRGSGSDDRGFASMDAEKQREAASKGGSASGGNFKNDPGRASEAGRKGGQASHSGGNPGGSGGGQGGSQGGRGR